MNLTREFLKAKHWQLFLLLVGLPMVAQFFLLTSFVASMTSGGFPDTSIVSPTFFAFPLLAALALGVMFGWLWSVAIGLQPKIPSHISMKVPKFKVHFFIPLVYTFTLLVGMTIFMRLPFTPEESDSQFNSGFDSLFMLIIIPHLLSMYCLFYCLYFTAKTMMTAELQRETSFSDFAGEFFLFWFHPIGVWVIQPRINKMAENLDETQR